MSRTPPRVVVVMATFEPDPALFHRQVGSIRSQTVSDFACVIHDDGSGAACTGMIERAIAGDERFVLTAHTENVGFYRNFERGLDDARRYGSEFIALSDQDDLWYPDKLATALDVLDRSAAALVFADVSIVDPQRRLLRPSFYERRHPTTASVLDLTMMNSAIGATCVFRTSLLDTALPFPSERPRSFHDHWLARCAQVTGGVEFIPHTAMEYVQHEANVQGAAASTYHLADFVHATRTPRDEFRSDAELVQHRLSELVLLQSRLPATATATAQRELATAIAVHERCAEGSRGAFVAMMSAWVKDQHLRTRARHEHIEVRYARAALYGRAFRRKATHGA